MNRSILIIIVIVLALALVGVGLVLFWQPGILNGNVNTNSTTNQANANLPGTSNSNTTTNQSANANTNTAPTNVNVTYAYNAKTLETNALGQRVTYRGAEIGLNRVEIRDGITGLSPAPDGKKWVYVFLEREVLAHTPSPIFWVTQEATLRDDQNNVYTLAGLGLPNTETLTTEEGYFSFLVDQPAQGFVFRLVRTDEDVSVDLGL